MKIDKIEIYGYGKWLHQKFEDLNELQIFLGDNEAGKSTLSSFIHTMFFGFPSARKKDSNTYVPKQGEAYGGRLFLTGTRFGELWVERVKERNRGKAVLTYPDGQQEVIHDLAAYLLGVDRETYELLYTFQIDSLLELNKVKRADLNRYLLSVGTSGSEKLLQLADQYRKEAQKQFKPTGTIPPLNKKIQEAEKLQLKLQEAKQKNGKYESLLLEASSIQQQIEEASLRQNEWEKENRELSESIRLNDYYREWLRLKAAIAAVDVSVLPKDARNVWERLQGRIHDDLQNQTVLQERLRNAKKQQEEYTHVDWYKTHQKELTALQHELPKIMEQDNRKLFLLQNREREQAELQQYRQENEIPADRELSPLDEKAMEEAKELLEAENERKNQRNAVIQKLNQNEVNLEALEKRIDDMKKNLLPEQTFQEWEKRVKQPADPTHSTAVPNTLSTGFLLFGVAALVGGVVLPNMRVYAVLIGLFSFAFGEFLLRKKKALFQKEPFLSAEDGFSMQTYIQQASMRERLKELEEEATYEQEHLLQLLNKQEEWELQLQALQTKQQEWVQARNYPAHLSIKWMITVDPAAVIKKHVTALEENQQELKSVEAELDQWQERTRFVRDHFQLNHLNQKEFLDQFSEIHQAVVLEESMARNVQDQIIEIQQELEGVQNSLEENQAKRKEILKQAHVETEAEFYQLLHAKEEQGEHKRRRDFLAEQLEGKEALMEKYPDKEAAERLLEQNKRLLQKIQEELKDWQRKEVAVRHDIDLLEKGGTYSSLLQEYAMTETELREMIVDWGQKVIAAEWLEDTLREGRNDRLPLILTDLNHYFMYLTQGAYSRVIFQKSGLKVQHENGVMFHPHELSQGTVEQLYIAMRFAFIKNTADIANLPILIDDGFVNFDQSRKEAMYGLMQEWSSTVQIFFFTFDKKAADFFPEEQLCVL